MTLYLYYQLKNKANKYFEYNYFEESTLYSEKWFP